MTNLTLEQQKEHIELTERFVAMPEDERYWLLKIAFDHRWTTERDPLSLQAR